MIITRPGTFWSGSLKNHTENKQLFENHQAEMWAIANLASGGMVSEKT